MVTQQIYITRCILLKVNDVESKRTSVEKSVKSFRN